MKAIEVIASSTSIAEIAPDRAEWPSIRSGFSGQPSQPSFSGSVNSAQANCIGMQTK